MRETKRHNFCCFIQQKPLPFPCGVEFNQKLGNSDDISEKNPLDKMTLLTTRRERKDPEEWYLSKCRGVAANVIKLLWVGDVSNLEETFNCTEFAVEET